MPVIKIDGNKIDIEKKRELVKRITEIACDIYDLPEGAITILINELEREDIGVGGELLLDMG
ncbi:MAG: 4-oxalocrotonate tautomerase DmpI [Methanobacteriaceae archaeon]